VLTLLRLATEFPGNSPGEGGMPFPESRHSMCRLATGRSALYHLIGRLAPLHCRTVLLPCYVAEGVIKPFVIEGYLLRFYRLTPDLRPDEDHVAALLREVNGRAVFMMVHLFGFPSASASLLDMLSMARMLVVSDCAHAPLSRTNDGELLGSVGHIALYSLNKILPVCDGALLLSNSPEIDVDLSDTVLPVLPATAMDAYRGHLAACRALYCADSLAQAQVEVDALVKNYEAYYEIINNDMMPYRQSDESRRIEEVFPYRTCAKVRRRNAIRLLNELRSPVIKPVHRFLPEHVVPFCIPARVPSGKRAGILQALFKRGVVLSTLADKWDFVPAGQEDQFPVEAAFLKEHVLIPVSEFFSDADMSVLINELNRIC
jgi:hypothetical protein